MTHEGTETHCDVFRREDDIQSMRVFCDWLSAGGMDQLRELTRMNSEYQSFKKVGFATFCKVLWGAFFAIIGLGVAAFIKSKS
jgi:hypothetical protein